MRFTEAEAKAQVGKWIRVRDVSWGCKRIAKGQIGEVVSAQLHPREEGAPKEEVWGVCIEFYLSRDHCVSSLIRDIDKEQYERVLEEISTRKEHAGRVQPVGREISGSCTRTIL